MMETGKVAGAKLYLDLLVSTKTKRVWRNKIRARYDLVP